MSYADLELSFRAAAAGGYLVDARFRGADAAADDDLVNDARAPLDPQALLQHALDPQAYGEALCAQLFADPELRQAWAGVKGRIGAEATPLRLRLRFEEDAAALHALRWELLQDPDGAAADPLALSEQLLLSRYLSAEGMAPVTLRERGALRALVVVASPARAMPPALAPLDVAAEAARAREQLGAIPAALLASGDGGARVTMDALGAAIREGPDILYLVAHGMLVEGEPYLWLEEPDGSADPTSAAVLAQRLRDLARRPVLVVLASCQSAGAGQGEADALAALGPRIVAAGVPAVIAMQGSVGLDTIAAMMPRLFAEIERHGEVDRALAAARLAALERPDWWMPALFMRLRDGCIWAEARADGDERHSVRGLASPYLGGEAYGYEQRDRYAGREREVQAALRLLTQPGAQRPLLFVTGTVGSGKSSFALAGLLPALEAHDRGAKLCTARARMAPGAHPLAALAEALRQLGLPFSGPLAAALPALVGPPPAAQPPDMVALLVVDQLEEVFTLADAAGRQALLDLLAALPPFAALRAHVVVTLRSDFLPELFAHQALYEQTKAGIELRAMGPEQLQRAITRPVARTYPHKELEPALLARLAADAAQSAAYLPLLQMTLDDLWRRGSLRLADYGTLADAVARRAAEVWRFADYDGAQAAERDPADRQLILELCAELVDAGDVPERDLPRPRELAELAQDEQGQPDARRNRLIDDLCAARLLSKEVLPRAGREVEVVSLIHETLLRNWPQLQAQVEQTRVARQRRARFRQALGEWAEHGRRDDYLLEPIRLAEAEALAHDRDVELRGPDARAFLAASVRRRDRRLRTARIVTAAMTALAAAALLLAFVAASLRGQAERSAEQARYQERRAVAQALAAQADAAGPRLPQRALLLALEAYRSLNTAADPLPVTEDALRTALERVGGIGLGGHTRAIYAVALSADGRTLVTASGDATLRVWDLGAADPNAAPRVLGGHTDVVRTAALSADGRTLVTSAEDRTVRVWDLTDPDPAATARILIGHQRDVERLVLAPDGSAVLTGADDTLAIFWDLTDPDPSATARVLVGHDDDVEAVALSADKRIAVTASDDGSVGVWDLGAPDPSASWRRLGGSGRPFTAVALTPDGERLIAGSEDGTIYLWRLADLDAPPATLAGSGAVVALALDASGRTLAAAGSDGAALVWSLIGDRPAGTRRVLLGHTEALTALALSPDGQLLATASVDGTARVWDLAPEGAAPPLVLGGHDAGVLALAMRRDKGLLVTGGVDGMARVWDLTGTRGSGAANLLRGHSAPITGLALTPDGARLVAASADRTAQLWELAALPGTAGRTLRAHAGGLTAVAVSPDGRTLATASQDATARLWDLASPGAPPRVLSGHTDSINDLRFSPDGRALVTVSQDDTARVWDLGAPDPRATARVLRGHENNVWEVLFSPDGRTVITGSEDNTIRLWDLGVPDISGRARVLSGHSGDILGLALSADGATLASVSEDGTLRVWDVAAPGQERERLALEAHLGRAIAVALSADGRTALTGGEDGLVRLWDLGAADPAASVRLLVGHEGPVTLLRLSPDERTLLSASEDNTARVWDLAAASPSERSRVLRGHAEPVTALLLTPDGRSVITGSADWTVRIWPLDVAGLLDAACRATGRNLSRAEWEQYFEGQPYRQTCPGIPPGIGVAPEAAGP